MENETTTIDLPWESKDDGNSDTAPLSLEELEEVISEIRF